MKSTPIQEYRIRSFYLNYLAIRQILSEDGIPEAFLSGLEWPAPELDYRCFGDTCFSSRLLSVTDVLILSRLQRPASLHYLQVLLAADNNDLTARKELDILRTRSLEGLRLFFGNSKLVENQSVVPASTALLYDEKLLSQKGKMLLDLYREGYPVPDFCILTSQSYNLGEEERLACLKAAISNLEILTGDTLDDPDRALVFAMRSATPFYIPGFMPTYLNVGITRNGFLSLEKRYGMRVANKIYLNNLKNICQILGTEVGSVRQMKPAFMQMNEESIQDQIRYLFRKIETVDERLLYDALYQAERFMTSSHHFFNLNQDLIYTFQRDHTTFPSLILQKMVWTILNKDSYPGVLYSRHPRTGLGMQIESVREIFGEDIMTGTVHAEQLEYFQRDEIKEEFPAIYHVTPILPWLEVKLKSPATIEFAVETSGGISSFAILQLNMSELTGRSTLLTAIDLYEKKVISKKRVIQLIRPYHLRQIFSERIDDVSLKSLTYFGSGISVLPRSAMSARIFFSMTGALEAKKRGERVCLCKETFIPSETIFLGELDVILCMNPLAIHVVTACLGYGIPAFINLKNHHIRLEEQAIRNEAGVTISKGDWITVSSKHRSIFLGKAYYKPARFQKYLEGQSLEMDQKEKTVFVNMARAYKTYQEILSTIKTEEAMTLSDVVKLIRNDYNRQPDKASGFVNSWFDAYQEHYYSEILKSSLGSHQDQHKIYSLLTTNRKILFFNHMIRRCRKEKMSGFTAGAFMLGRFLCQEHPVSFWKAFDASGIVFLLNEYILFEKYMKVLYEFGERHLTRIKTNMLTKDLRSITLSTFNTDVFLSLKLSTPDWTRIETESRSENDQETHNFIRRLHKPYGELIRYDIPWSYEKLVSLCDKEQLAVPDPGSI